MNRSHRAILVLAAAVLSLAGSDGFSEDPRAIIYRLPSTVTPLNYSLQIKPDLVTAEVTGTVVIYLQTTSDKNDEDDMGSIILHLGEDSEVDESTMSLVSSDQTVIGNLSLNYLDGSSMIQVKLPQYSTLDYDTIYILTLDFSSPLYTEPKGLFWGNYNSTSNYVASAFRATYARNLFPCFDEPQFQVPLVLRVLRPSTYNVIFTTTLESSISDGDMMLDTFEATPAGISLSSLGLFMSEITPVSKMGLNLYVPEGFNTSVNYLKTLITQITTTMGDFNVPAGTLNLVVLPDLVYTSFSSLGFVFTSPEVYLGEVSAQLQWLDLSQQLAEQFLQQYLAYARTPLWWSDLWLSDSLAAYLAINIWPQTSMEDLLMTQIRCKAFNKDYGDFSGPVVNPQLMARWDIENAIVNQTIKTKGLSILLMWHNTLPDGVVMKSVLSFTNLENTLTTTEDLLDIMVKALETAGFKNEAVINQIPFWLNSTGNPIVEVTSRNPAKAVLTLSYEGMDDVMWPVSISLATKSSHKNWYNYRQSHWLTSQTLSVKAKSADWLVLNLENAPYRVNYGTTSYSLLLAALEASNSSTIPTTVRAAIQSDVMDMALSGSLDFATALSVMNNTQHGQEDWLPVVRAMDKIAALMGRGDWGLSELGMYMETMFTEDMLDALDLTKSSSNPDQWLARALLTPWLCRFSIGNCREAVAQLATSVLLEGDTDSVDVNDMDNVACLGARYLVTSVDNILANFNTAANLPVKRMFTLALGCVIDPDSVQKVLSTVVNNPSQFAIRDVRDIMVGLASNVENSQAMASFIVENAESLQSMLGIAYLSDVITALGKFRIHATKLEELNSDDVDVDAYVKQTAMATVAKINSSFDWWSENGQAIEQALPQNTATSPHPTSGPSTAPTTTVATSTASTKLSTPATVKPGPVTTQTPVSAATVTEGTTLLSLLLLSLATILLANHCGSYTIF